MNRRQFFSYLFHLCASPLEKYLPNRRQRPPGAPKDDTEFKMDCTGCDACMAACPVNIIVIENMKTRHPVIFPDEAPCIGCLDTPCITACPTNALSLENLCDSAASSKEREEHRE